MAMWSKLNKWRKERRLEKMRHIALTYMAMLDTQMVEDNVPRCKRRQFKRELVNCGRHVKGVVDARTKLN